MNKISKNLAYIFRGAPSSGKGTLTRDFMKLVPGKVAYLELDNFRWGFHVINRKVKDITEEEHKFAYDNFLLMLESYCKNGQYNLVIEGLFSWSKRGAHGNMKDIINILDKYNSNYKIFFLKASYDTLWKRNKKRSYVVPKDEFYELFNYVGKENTSKETVINVNNITPKQTLELLKNHLITISSTNSN